MPGTRIPAGNEMNPCPHEVSIIEAMLLNDKAPTTVAR